MRSEILSVFSYDKGNPLKMRTLASTNSLDSEGIPTETQPKQLLSIILKCQEARKSESNTKSNIENGKQNINLKRVAQSAITYDFEYDTMEIDKGSDEDNDSIPHFDPNDQALTIPL